MGGGVGGNVVAGCGCGIAVVVVVAGGDWKVCFCRRFMVLGSDTGGVVEC